VLNRQRRHKTRLDCQLLGDLYPCLESCIHFANCQLDARRVPEISAPEGEQE
jgi:hypothetical protein